MGKVLVISNCGVTNLKREILGLVESLHRAVRRMQYKVENH